MSKATKPKILIVDDVPANLKMLYNALETQGYEILAASNGNDAIRIAINALPDIILLDILMPPGIDGYEVCRQLKQNPITEHIPIIFVTMRDDSVSLVNGFRIGGVDYITKPFEKEEVLMRVETHLKISHLTQELLRKNKELKEEIYRREHAEKAHKQVSNALQKADEQLSMISQMEISRWGIEAFIGKSNTIKKILDEVRELQNTGNTSILITGESGTGKELIARAIHFGGIKSKEPFIPINCSAIPKELAESAFFGHIKGAFSGANASKRGYFELADGGTLFLDEIGDMPLDLQPKLLRVIEDGQIMPLGGHQSKHVDVRIIAATNQDIEKKIVGGEFRQDLYWRLARFTVKIPPLRERREDIPLLIEHFLKIFAFDMNIIQPVLSSEAKKILYDYHFPGNVRELKNIIENALIRSKGGIIRPEHINLTQNNNHDLGQEQINHKNNHQIAEDLMIKRAKKPSYNDNSYGLTIDEEKILEYVRKNGSINNSECCQLLSVQRHRATYLLKKLCKYDLLTCKNELRWSRYYAQ